MSVALTEQITTALAQFSSETRLYALPVDDDAAKLGSDDLLVEAFAADDEVQGVGGRDVIVVSTDAHIPLEPLLGQHATLEVSLANGRRTSFAGDITEIAMHAASELNPAAVRMKTVIAIALLPLLIAVTAAGEDLTAAKKVTAQMIVDVLRTREGGLHKGAEINQARGYLRGAKDSANVEWCPPAWLPNLEIDGEIVGYLAGLPPAARQGDAALQVAAALRAKFPCPSKKER